MGGIEHYYRRDGHEQKARLITKHTFGDPAMIYISYDGETVILRIVILKLNLTAWA